MSENNTSINTNNKLEMGFFGNLFSNSKKDESKIRLMESKEIISFRDVFTVNNYESIEFGPWRISNYNSLECKKFNSVYNYFMLSENFKCEYHMFNGIIYTIEYDPEDKSISISTVGGFKRKYTDLKYTYK